MAANLAHDRSQWRFSKEVTQTKRSKTRAISMDLYHVEERLQIGAPMEVTNKMQAQQGSQFNDHYLSSEEALSPMEPDQETSDGESFSELADDDFQFDEDAYQDKKPICDLAVVVAIIPVGPPKVVDVPISPVSSLFVEKRPSRSSSLQKESEQLEEKKDGAVDMTVRTPRFSATSFAAFSTEVQRAAYRPSSPLSRPPPRKRFSVSSVSRITTQTGTPTNFHSTLHLPISSPFLSQDPFEAVSTGSNTPSVTGHPSRSRLRSLSRTIGITRLGSRRALESRTTTSYQDSVRPATPARSITVPVSIPTANSPTPRKMVARGAAAREPPITLPPFPDAEFGEGIGAIATQRRRKSVRI